MRALVTGSDGSIGRALVVALDAAGHSVGAFDLTTGCDVLDRDALEEAMYFTEPDVIFHLAGAKHAPDGELDPWATVQTNVEGTRNVLDLAPEGCKVITASTCKAADPETVYGATKLLAERLTLKAGGSVARFYNVRESSGNVFRIWENVPATDPIEVAPCWRYFIGIDDAVRLLLRVAELPPGRYTVDPGAGKTMRMVAKETHPGRSMRYIEPRRGDRRMEPRHAHCEWLESVGGGIERVRSRHES